MPLKSGGTQKRDIICSAIQKYSFYTFEENGIEFRIFFPVTYNSGLYFK